MDEIVSTGSIFDQLLNGGFEKEVITTIYGPAGSGKTNVALLTLCHIIKNGGKVIYVDTEGSFSASRAEQILPDFQKYAKNVVFLRPFTFEDQKKSFLLLKEKIEENPKQYTVVIIDSIAMLYRLEVGKTLDVSFVNKELAIQLGILTEIARKHNVPSLITNQVYSDFENRDMVKMVGGDLLKYTSKCLIELKKAKSNLRIARLIKHRSLPEGKELVFKIIDSGIEQAQIPKLPQKIDSDEFV
ncbi:MAG: DNA repair and recombination protein RadB [Candidatus Woesearchaeota archaeon]